ncbi:MAG: hypothetical protein AAB614_01870 [Patescibacteria group bacterium]
MMQIFVILMTMVLLLETLFIALIHQTGHTLFGLMFVIIIMILSIGGIFTYSYLYLGRWKIEEERHRMVVIYARARWLLTLGSIVAAMLVIMVL